MAAAQALDFRNFESGRGTRAAHAEIRSHVDFLDDDRPLYRDHNAMKAATKKLTSSTRLNRKSGSSTQ